MSLPPMPIDLETDLPINVVSNISSHRRVIVDKNSEFIQYVLNLNTQLSSENEFIDKQHDPHKTIYKEENIDVNHIVLYDLNDNIHVGNDHAGYKIINRFVIERIVTPFGNIEYDNYLNIYIEEMDLYLMLSHRGFPRTPFILGKPPCCFLKKSFFDRFKQKGDIIMFVAQQGIKNIVRLFLGPNYFKLRNTIIYYYEQITHQKLHDMIALPSLIYQQCCAWNSETKGSENLHRNIIIS